MKQKYDECRRVKKTQSAERTCHATMANLAVSVADRGKLRRSNHDLDDSSYDHSRAAVK